MERLLEEIDMRAIAAVDENGTMGNGGSLPWRIPEEMEFFRRTTLDATVLMGRRTFESIGRPLPRRMNIVLTRNPSWSHAGVIAISDPERLLSMELDGPLWVCGGAMVYEMLLPVCRELYLSRIFGQFVGDIKFPPTGEFFVKTGTILTCNAFEVDHYANSSFAKWKDERFHRWMR
jgi:dihydrofolate reductase